MARPLKEINQKAFEGLCGLLLAEKATAEKWELSPREKEIVRKLGKVD